MLKSERQEGTASNRHSGQHICCQLDSTLARTSFGHHTVPYSLYQPAVFVFMVYFRVIPSSGTILSCF